MVQPTFIDAPLTTKKKTTVKSHIHPWLTQFVYPLGCYLVIPGYFGRIIVTGRENIPTSGPVIVAPTHCARWDAVIVPYAVGRLASGRDLRFMVSADEMKGIQGWFIERLGGFPVNTSRPGISSLIHTVKLLRDGEMVVIFPEGGIHRDKKVHPLKPGVARMALEVAATKNGADIQILPVSIHYAQPYPQWGCDVTINIGSPIRVADYNKGLVKENTEQLTQELTRSLKYIHEAEQEPLTMMAETSLA